MIMMAIYTAILAFSAYLASFLGARTLSQLARNAGLPAIYAQVAIPLSFIAFLMVASLATGVLLAALLMMLSGAMNKPQTPLMARTVLLPMVAAILLATLGVWESPGVWPASVPVIGFLFLAALIFAAALSATYTAELSLPVVSGVALAAALPLMLAPLVFLGAHGSIALDVALILAAVAGGLVVLPESSIAASFVRMPLAIMMAYGAVQAMHYGAWPLGIVSLLIWLAGVKLMPRSLQAGL